MQFLRFNYQFITYRQPPNFSVGETSPKLQWRRRPCLQKLLFEQSKQQKRLKKHIIADLAESHKRTVSIGLRLVVSLYN